MLRFVTGFSIANQTTSASGDSTSSRPHSTETDVGSVALAFTLAGIRPDERLMLVANGEHEDVVEVAEPAGPWLPTA